MEITKNTIPEEVWKQLTTQWRNTRKASKINYPKDKLEQLLLYCYGREVIFRGMEFKPTDEICGIISKVAGVMTDDGSKFGVMLIGNVGNGKSTLMKAMQKAMSTLVDYGVYPYGFGLRIVYAKDIHNTVDNRKRFDLLCHDELLGIDDLGTEPKEEMNYGSVTTPINDLLEYRYNRQLFTVVSTNLTPSQIKERYGLRIADRCREMFVNIVFKGESYR